MSNDEIVSRTRLLDSEIKVCTKCACVGVNFILLYSGIQLLTS